MDRPIRVFVLDDQEVVRRGLRDLLDLQPDMVVCGESSTAADAVGRIVATSPDVALLDIGLPDGDGVHVCREARARLPELRVLMLTALDDDAALLDAIAAGASGAIAKQVRCSAVLDDIRRVAAPHAPALPR